MLQTKQVRQGALVLHIEPDGKVTYEICLAVPFKFIASSTFKDCTHIIGKRKFIRKWGLTWEQAMRIKLMLQIEVDAYKLQFINDRKTSRQYKLFEFLAS